MPERTRDPRRRGGIATNPVTAFLLALTLAGCDAHSQSSSAAFQVGIVGSAPSGRMNPTTMMNTPGVRAFILRLADGPVREEAAGELVQRQGYTVAEVVSAGLARREGAVLRLAVNFVSAGDQRLIARHARAYGNELADLVLARRAELQAAVAPHAATDDRRLAVLFFLVGCVALDWDGLAFTAERGYRAGATVTGAGFAYTPWMKENAPDVSRRGLYWGSHNRAAGEQTFTTFGDHDALPRRALPDILFSAGNSFPFALADVSAVLVAVHRGASDVPRIAETSGVAASRVPAILAQLDELAYTRRTADGIALQVTVLDADLAPAAARVVAIVRDAIDVWHARRYANVRADLAALTALDQGVPFEVLYSEIWHYVFGYANFFLAERGLIADPYQAGAPFRGFLPFLWAAAVSPSS